MKHLNRWVYAGVGVVVLLMAGLIYAWTVMSKSIAASRPDWSAASLSLTFTIVMAFFCIGGLVRGILSKRISARVCVIIAGVLLCAGFWIASLTGEGPVLLYLGFGALCGLGAGFAYNAVMGTISAWFPDKQGLISGILLMGFGLSSFIIGKVFAAVAPSDGTDSWQITFRVLGVILVALMVLCSIFIVRPGEDFTPPAPSAKKAVRQPALDVNTLQMVKKPSFWLIYLYAILISAAGLALVGQASGIATQVGAGISDGTIATVVGLISILNGIGRVVYGGMYDKAGYRLTMLLDMVNFIAASVILILALVTESFALIVVGFVVGGFAYGGVTPLQSAIISDFYGRTHYSTNFSIIVTNLLVASFASTVAGALYDATQSYLSTVYMMIVVTAASFLVFLGIRRPKSDAAK